MLLQSMISFPTWNKYLSSEQALIKKMSLCVRQTSHFRFMNIELINIPLQKEAVVLFWSYTY